MTQCSFQRHSPPTHWHPWTHTHISTDAGCSFSQDLSPTGIEAERRQDWLGGRQGKWNKKSQGIRPSVTKMSILPPALTILLFQAHSKARGNGVCTLDSSGRILLSVGTCVPLLRIHILKLPRKAQMTQSYSNPLSPWMPS